MTSETISIIANVAIALSFLLGLVFGVAQVRAAALDRRERLTLETLRAFQTRDFVSLMHFITARDMPATMEAMRALPDGDQVNYIQFAQEMESVGILVAQKLINLDLVDITLGSFVITAWDKYKAVFADIRKKQPDPFLGEYFQWLAERITERMEQNPRKPFHQSRQQA
jgi:hypothetical protein